MNHPRDGQSQEPTEPRVEKDADEPHVLTTNQLFGSNHELLIDHAGEVYRLRITRNNKLILTK